MDKPTHVQAAALLMQLPGNEPRKDGPNVWIPSTLIKDTDEAAGFSLAKP